MSLNNLSLHLSNLGQQEDALRAVEEAVERRRQLAADQPAAFIPVLASSLKNLSDRLSDLGHQEDALKAIEETVELYRQLAAESTCSFSFQFLPPPSNNLSNHFV